MAQPLDLPAAPPAPPSPSTWRTSVSRAPTLRPSLALRDLAGYQGSDAVSRTGALEMAAAPSTSSGPATMTSTDDGLIAFTLLPNPPYVTAVLMLLLLYALSWVPGHSELTGRIPSLPTWNRTLPRLPADLAQYLSDGSPLSPAQKRVLFTTVYLRAASAGNSDLLEWLLSLPHNPQLSTAENAANAKRFSLSRAQRRESQLSISSFSAVGPEAVLPGVDDDLPDWVARKWVDLDGRDDEGNPAIVLAVAFRHAEAVRILVESGASIDQADRAGWTGLHWAAQSNDIPIASYLLNHRASPLLASHRGLTPRDLAAPGPTGLAMREVLSSAWEAAIEREKTARRALPVRAANGKGKGKALQQEDGDESGAATLSRSDSRMSLAALSEVEASTTSWEEDRERERAEEAERQAVERQRWQLALESAAILRLDLKLLGIKGPQMKSGRDPPPDEEDGDSSPAASFEWDHCLPDQMMVFSLADLPLLLDLVVSLVRPICSRKFRTIPANVVFLAARYAHYYGGSELFEELMFGTLERIENSIHARPEDAANCFFWLSNCLLILYYLRAEPNLAPATTEYQGYFADLINEILVFVIRDAERRIDRILEAAVVEHDSLPGFEDVVFEDEWASTRFVKKLTGRAKKSAGIRNSTSAMSLFSDAGSTTSADGLANGGGLPGSPARTRPAEEDSSPKDVTDVLSATLFVLQLYEIPPVVILQAFSQLFYWLACEIFNRILTQRKYLCRSRAMQVRLNISTLEDWARTSRLPTKMIAAHFAPLNQLLQWLQCLSSESSIDGLIGTVDTLRALNPAQLRKAARDYRYEADEAKIPDDCVEYLAQLERQWERQTAQEDAQKAGGTANEREAATGEQTSSLAASSQADDRRRTPNLIESIARDSTALSSYVPPSSPPCRGELLNSRHMLPISLPTSAEHLVHFDGPVAFGSLADVPQPARRSCSATECSAASRQSDVDQSVEAPAQPDTSEDSTAAVRRHVPILPDDFFAVLDNARRRAGNEAIPPVSASLLAKADVEDAFKTPRLGGDGFDDDEGPAWWNGASPPQQQTSYSSPASKGGSPRAPRQSRQSLVSATSLDPDSSFESSGDIEETPRPSFGFRF